MVAQPNVAASVWYYFAICHVSGRNNMWYKYYGICFSICMQCLWRFGCKLCNRALGDCGHIIVASKYDENSCEYWPGRDLAAQSKGPWPAGATAFDTRDSRTSSCPSYRRSGRWHWHGAAPRCMPWDSGRTPSVDTAGWPGSWRCRRTVDNVGTHSGRGGHSWFEAVVVVCSLWRL